MKKTVQSRDIITSGIMTGNSLDAIDVATFRATVTDHGVSQFEQIGFHSSPCTERLREQVFGLKAALKESRGNLTPTSRAALGVASELYHHDVNEAVLLARAALRSEKGLEIDLIGFHGQTLGHAPPSVVVGDQRPYTIQMVDGGVIADAQKVVTVSDFRSDDLLNGGEGAPFAPGYNALLVSTLGVDTAVFINAGNTSNIAIIHTPTGDVRGWDCGPCNQFSDLLMREERGVGLDRDGATAASGTVVADLLKKLWESAVVKDDGSNALELRGPRSFDPQWYRLPAELKDSRYPFEDRIRTVVAFSAYCVAHSLATAVEAGFMPETILLFGGGWRNPVLVRELKDLCTGKAQYILSSHVGLFSSMRQAIPNLSTVMRDSDEAGLPSNGMEAGIFAFAAIQRLLNRPFTQPSFTNCKSPTICGAVQVPMSGEVSSSLSDLRLSDERGLFKERRLGRAAPDNQ
jgi:anhydro-N-acetylmuramic acid kinase